MITQIYSKPLSPMALQPKSGPGLHQSPPPIHSIHCNPPPVSYPHVSRVLCNAIFPPLPRSTSRSRSLPCTQQSPLRAVSYTHLDVYKRQIQYFKEVNKQRQVLHTIVRWSVLCSRKTDDFQIKQIDSNSIVRTNVKWSKLFTVV